MKFINGIKTPINDLVVYSKNLSYLPWATAIALANRPQQEVVTHSGKPYLEAFGGAIVAIDMPNTSNQGANSRVWLPVLDHEHLPIALDKITPRDILDSVSRCKAKAIAMNTGVGMSLYCGFDEDIKGFLQQLGVRPETNLYEHPPMFIDVGDENGTKYVEWAIAYTAAKITDPFFHFHVETFEGQTPYQKIGAGYAVAVTITYKSTRHTEWLSIMDEDNSSLSEPTVFDWNKAVMRCLTKAIAVVSGYGLNIYAKEELSSLLERRPLQRKGSLPTQCTREQEIIGPSSCADLPHTASAEAVARVRGLLKSRNLNETDVLLFLSSEYDSLDNIPMQILQRVEAVASQPTH